MNRRLIGSILSITCWCAIPVAALATTYTINVPVQMSKVNAPAGTTFGVTCNLSSSIPPQPPYTVSAVGWAPPLDATGAATGTVSISMTPTGLNTMVVRTYFCSMNSLDSNNRYAPPSTPTVSGSFPGATPPPVQNPNGRGLPLQ
jgi:hypothetical protein